MNDPRAAEREFHDQTDYSELELEPADDVVVSRAYTCQFAKCVRWFHTPQELSEHYETEHGARR